MTILYLLAGAIFVIFGLVCSIIVLIEAFRDEIWKGIACLLCGFYALWFMLMDFDHDQKWLVILGAVGGGSLGGVFLTMAGGGN